jgi:hypothetical protein
MDHFKARGLASRRNLSDLRVFPMDENEIDRWIERLANQPEDAIENLEKLGGEPALHRLYQANEGTLRIPFGGDPRDALTNRSLALGRLGARYPETFLSLVQGKIYFTLGTIQALGFTGDPRLKAIAKEALKNFGNNW